MKRGLILLAVCVSTVVVIGVLLAGVGTAVSAAAPSNPQLPPLESVEIIGPVTVTVGTAYVYTAVVTPPTATQPISYSWNILGDPNWTLTEIDNTATIQWAEPGNYGVYVTAHNSINSAETTLTVTVMPKNPAADIYTNRNMTSLHQDGLINTSNQALFGPNSCTAFGDPFSPLQSPFRPPGTPSGPYTYHYRILIPANYPDNILRVELFDPDTYNAPANSATVIHTTYAVSNGFPFVENLNCPSTSRSNPCLINTNEEILISPPNITIDQINPYWFVRIDEHRSGIPDTNTGCGTPSYSDSNGYNTTTLYELSYFRQNNDGTTQEIDLSTYTGKPNNNDNTDMHWVSPGGPASSDHVYVPADAGSPKPFQLDLNTDVPNMLVEPGTGNRYLYLDITTIGGASENGFEVWAGPDDYISSTPSEVNERNITILDAPGSHSSSGVQVFAQDYLILNSNSNNRVNIPLLEIGPEYAGETVSVSLFDTDSGTVSPLTFYFDSIAQADWSLSFGNGGTDPDGVPSSSRCFPSCNNQWITPAYQITVPGNLANCDYNNPTVADCTPFFGGTLFASLDGGESDTYGWQVAITEPTNPNPTAGCAAFPIAIELGSRSVHPPNTGTGNDYPNPGDFHPSSPAPPYSNFPNNVPDVSLQGAQEGYVYKIQNGNGSGSFGWLVWNNGIFGSASTLANSLTWPGNSQDYADHGDGGQPATPLYPYVVRGYVNPYDTSDLGMNMDDWVTVQTGSVNSNALRDAVYQHIIEDRYLRLVVWSEDLTSSPPSPHTTNGRTYFGIEGFAIFRLKGHNLSQSGTSWLLLEFVEWDTSCGQLPTLTEVMIEGPTVGNAQIPYTFTASVASTFITTPVTYTWQADGQLPVIHVGGITDTVSYTWPITGQHMIAVTAENITSAVATTHLITILAPIELPVPLTAVTLTGALTGEVGLDYAFTAVVTPISATQPITYHWQATDQPPITHSNGLSNTMAYSWTTPGPKTLIVTAENITSIVSATHIITIVAPIEPPVPLTAVTLTGSLTGAMDMDYAFMSVVTPISATQPITYHWQATDQLPLTQTGGLTNTISFSWGLTGTKVITVTADNGVSMVTAVHTILIQETIIIDPPHQIYLPFIAAHPP